MQSTVRKLCSSCTLKIPIIQQHVWWERRPRIFKHVLYLLTFNLLSESFLFYHRWRLLVEIIFRLLHWLSAEKKIERQRKKVGETKRDISL